MADVRRNEILAEIRRTAEENGGRRSASASFKQMTGIGPYAWGRFWPRFTEAQREAGFEPNGRNPALDGEARSHPHSRPSPHTGGGDSRRSL